MSGGPILLGGLDRSGKTQLRLALDVLPGVAWTRRAEPWANHAGRLGDVRVADDAERAIGRLVAAPELAGLTPDAARLRAELPSALGGAETRAVAECRLLGLVLAQHAADEGIDRWGLQEAGIERHAPMILDAFPDARCVILVRDPRDRLAAMLADRRGPGMTGPATRAWLASVRQARRAVARHPDRVLIVRLEDLVARPAETLRTICEHLELAFEPALLRPGGGDPFAALGASVGAYRARLSRGQVAFVQRLAGRAMIALGYDPVPTPLAVSDRIGYWLIEMPLGLGRLAVSRARTAVSGRLS